ncbi:MAG TPA: ANTAR domain-containing protein [Blastococcus sp.]
MAGDGVSAEEPAGTGGIPAPSPRVALTRTAQGWSVISPAGADDVADIVEGMSLADLVAEELGLLAEPDRAARRSARGNSPAAEDDGELVDARVAALERTVAQLEHALAARVSTERAIGVLAERHATSARSAFETLRRDARSQGRPVADLAREVLDSLPPGRHQDDLPPEATSDGFPAPGAAAGRAMPAQRRRQRSVDAALPPSPSALERRPAAPVPDGRS